MKIIFDGYYYFDYKNNDKKTYDARLSNAKADSWRAEWQFDQQKFNTLIAQGRHEDAAQYAEKFHFTNRAKNDELRRNIAKLRREGEQLTALKQNMTPSDYNLYMLGQAINNGGDLRSLMTPGKNVLVPGRGSVDGSDADQLMIFLNRLGSSRDLTQYASSLSLEFLAKKQSALGIDWLAADNDYADTVGAFYERLGLTEDQLKENGIEIVHNDSAGNEGNTVIKFSKSNPLAFKLLKHFYNEENKSYSDTHRIKGYDDNGKEITDAKESANYANIMDILGRADAKVTEVKQSLHNTVDTHIPLRVGPLLTDEIYKIEDARQKGQLSDEQYKYAMGVATQHAYDAIRAMGSGEQQMFSNYMNENAEDNSLNMVDNVNRSKLKDYISYSLEKRADNVRLQTAVRDGEYGVLLTVDAHDEADDSEHDVPKGKEIQVFLPGFQSALVQEAYDNDANTRAINEINSIKDYGYKYKLNNDETLQYTPSGGFVLSRGNNTVMVDESYAEKKVHEDLLINDAKDAIMEKYTNADGTITDIDGFQKEAKAFAIAAANEIYSELPDIGTKDNTLYDAEKIFNEKKVTDKNTQYELWNKILAARNIYELLLTELSNYR